MPLSRHSRPVHGLTWCPSCRSSSTNRAAFDAPRRGRNTKRCPCFSQARAIYTAAFLLRNNWQASGSIMEFGSTTLNVLSNATPAFFNAGESLLHHREAALPMLTHVPNTAEGALHFFLHDSCVLFADGHRLFHPVQQIRTLGSHGRLHLRQGPESCFLPRG